MKQHGWRDLRSAMWCAPVYAEVLNNSSAQRTAVQDFELHEVFEYPVGSLDKTICLRVVRRIRVRNTPLLNEVFKQCRSKLRTMV